MEENVVVKKDNKSLIIIIAVVVILLIGGIGIYVWNSHKDEEKVEKKETKKEEKKETKPDTNKKEKNVDTTEWGNKYYSYIKSKFTNDDYDVEGYFVDLLNDGVPEIVIYLDNDEDTTMTAVLYIDNGTVKKSKEYEDGYLAFLYNLKTNNYDSWYIVSIDDDNNDLYSHPSDIISGKVTSSSIILKTEDDIEKFNDSYIEIPLDLDRHTLNSSDFDEDELAEMISEYESYDIKNDDIKEFIENIKEDMN